jgi:hypothetical protein
MNIRINCCLDFEILFYSLVRSFRTTSLGLPAAWLTIVSWMNAISMSFPTPEPEPEHLQMKNPEIQVLRNYRGKAPESFWSEIPFRSLPNQAETRVNVDSFRDYVNMALPSWLLQNLLEVLQLFGNCLKEHCLL